MGAWLGLVFGAVVLISGDAAPFLAVNPLGAIVTVIVKGMACGYFAGLTYRLIAKLNTYAGVAVAAVVCPVVNTGIFLIGCLLFFMEIIEGWAIAAGFSGDIGGYILFVLVGANFLFELCSNVILSPIIVRLLKAKSEI